MRNRHCVRASLGGDELLSPLVGAFRVRRGGWIRLGRWRFPSEVFGTDPALCFADIYSPDAEYVDLLLNPERYTGYKGPDAWKIWNSIYEENCFK